MTYKKPKPTHITLRARWRILNRDNFRCQACGKYGLDTIRGLEVDHIIPVSKGGTHEDHNLRTLCYECNRGKSNLSLGESQ